jgi:uncharacterized membrane protein YvbJ
MLTGADGQLVCVYCSSTFGEVTRICPRCGHYNETVVRHCAECGAALVRDCPACGTANWVLADHCVQCGRNLDLIEEMTQRWQRSTADRLQQRRTGIPQIQEAEARASQQRMASLLEEERLRQQDLALAQKAQRERERQLWVLMAVAIAVFLIIIVLSILLTSGS